jgi:hypothetical protein
MCDGGDGLHFNGVHFFKRMVENTGSIDGLKAEVFVVEVADKERFGSKGIWLNIDIGAGDGFEEGGFADIGIAADKESSGIGVYTGKTTEMLSDLLEIDQGLLQSSTDCGHTTKSGSFERLALEERLGIFEQPDIVS